MSFLYLLEEIRNPVFDFLFSAITLLGEETIFMAVGMFCFWCCHKYKGYYLLCTGFAGTLINQFLKMQFRVPRPWVKDPSFTIVEAAREGASGYSFPSGHTQTSVGLYGGVARSTTNRILRIFSIAFCVLIPFSRLYLGVHTPMDVGVSVAIALALLLLFAPLFEQIEKKKWIMYTILSVFLAGILAFLCFTHFTAFPESVYAPENLHNLESARKNGFTLLGCVLGLFCVYALDETYLHFKTEAIWWAQILKTFLGLGVVIAVKEGLRFPLNAILPADSWARTVRYFFMVLTGGFLWPMTFPFFAKLGQKSKN